jgi:hypothetical protein
VLGHESGDAAAALARAPDATSLNFGSNQVNACWGKSTHVGYLSCRIASYFNEGTVLE